MFRSSAILIASLIAAGALMGQRRGASSPNNGFRADSRLVLLPLTVTDRQGRLVNGLRSADFVVLEDGQVQQVSSFSEQEEPVSLGIVVDTSGSMRDVLLHAKECLRQVVDQLGPDDEAFLYVVGTHPEKRTDLTHDLERLPASLQFVRANGDTALVDTVWSALDRIRSGRHARKALLVISDGIDNHSRYSSGELMGKAAESDVRIGTIALYDVPRNRKAMEMQQEQRGRQLLAQLSRATGGLSFVVRERAGMKQASLYIARALHDQYVLGYVPQSGESEGKWRAVRVTVNFPGLSVHTRSRYRFE